MNVPSAVIARIAGSQRRRSDLDSRLSRIRDQLLSRMFPAQKRVFLDTHQMKTMCVPRGGGKTTADASMLIDAAVRNPLFPTRFIAKTKDHAVDLIWAPLLRLCAELGLHPRVNNMQHRLIFEGGDSGSGIWVDGAADMADVGKYRGIPHARVVVDEVQNIHPDVLRSLVRDAIQPRLADAHGDIILGGTPQPTFAGFWYEASGPTAQIPRKDPDGMERAIGRPYLQADDPTWQRVMFEWSQHHWSLEENVFVPELWSEAQRIKHLLGWSDDHPLWRREYRGEWAEDSSDRFIPFLPERDVWVPGPRSERNPYGLPEGHDWEYILSCDFGYTLPFAFGLWADSPTYPVCFEVWEREMTAPTITEIADVYHEIKGILGAQLRVFIGDFPSTSKGNTYITTLGRDHGIGVVCADKKDKPNIREYVAGELQDERVKIINGKLAHEWVYLTWNAARLKEKDGQPNHFSDMALYAIKESRHTMAHERQIGPEVYSKDWLEARAREAKERAETADLHRNDAVNLNEVDIDIGGGGDDYVDATNSEWSI